MSGLQKSAQKKENTRQEREIVAGCVCVVRVCVRVVDQKGLVTQGEGSAAGGKTGVWYRFSTRHSNVVVHPPLLHGFVVVKFFVSRRSPFSLLLSNACVERARDVDTVVRVVIE